MSRSISIVEYKVEQARFFLEQIPRSKFDFFAAQCLTDAFASACRSITFSMQAVVGEVDGFKPWYEVRIEQLKNDRLFRFFNEYRVASTHIGDTVVRGGASGTSKNGTRVVRYFFTPIPDLPDVPAGDVFSICKTHFTSLLNLVFDAFTEFLCQLDDRWYFTAENFKRMGKSFDDALSELGFPPEWAAVGSGILESEKWRALRQAQTVGCQLNPVFQSYLGKIIAGPDDTVELSESRAKSHRGES